MWGFHFAGSPGIQLHIPKRGIGIYACSVLRENLQLIKRDPSLLLVEVAWRWLFGAAALALLAFGFVRLQHGIAISPEEESQLTSLAPDSIVLALAAISQRVLPVLLRLAELIIPSLLVLWVVAASVGRAIVMTKLIGPENARLNWAGLVGAHALRALSVVGFAGAYVASSFLVAWLSGSENPNYLLSILASFVLFAVVLAVWMWMHWILSLAAIYPATEGAGIFTAVRAALHLVRMKGGELTGIAAGNGTARTVVALVFTFLGLLPLPLYRVAPTVLMAMEIVIALVYCVVSDWMLVARLLGYLEVATSDASVPFRSAD